MLGTLQGGQQPLPCGLAQGLLLPLTDMKLE
jgi:hypothetical protein